MDAGLKQRLIGAAVLVALAVIFLPMLVKGPAPDSGVSDLPMRVPDAPDGNYRTIDLPLVVPAGAPEGGVLPTPDVPVEGDPLPTVDTAHAPPAGGRPAAEDAAEPAVPPTVAAGDYVVHFGAFSSERDAQLIVTQLAGAGLSAYHEPFELGGRPAQRVRLGPFASREAAEAVRVRAAQVRNDVTPRVVALDAGATPAPVASSAPAAAPAPRPSAPAPEPARPVAAAPKPATPPAPTPAPAAAPAPAPAAAPTSGVGFAVQLGAFGNAAEAQRLRDRLRAAGITAFTDTVSTDKGRLTRVKAGPVSSRQEAERLKAQVKAKVGVDGMVRSHP